LTGPLIGRATRSSNSFAAVGWPARTSTRAPAADSNSAFHSAPGDPPATTAFFPSILWNKGRLGSGAIRGGTSSGARFSVMPPAAPAGRTRLHGGRIP
jgi:hypothetical protein